MQKERLMIFSEVRISDAPTLIKMLGPPWAFLMHSIEVSVENVHSFEVGLIHSLPLSLSLSLSPSLSLSLSLSLSRGPAPYLALFPAFPARLPI